MPGVTLSACYVVVRLRIDAMILMWLRTVAGILRNISPIPPPSIAATVDLDRDVILPTLEPVLGSIDLQEASQAAQHAVDNKESCLNRYVTVILRRNLTGVNTATRESDTQNHH